MDVKDPQLAGLRARARPIPLGEEERGGWAAQFARLPAMQFAEIGISMADEKLVHAVLANVRDHHLGGLQVRAVNGAVLAGLFDCTLGIAGTLQFAGKRAGTCELSLKFMRAVFDTPVDVFGACVKKTETLAFVESELYSAGRLCALATGIVAVASGRGDEEAIW
jgi:acyl-coenzyme A thioesterase PaaI-like protein